MLFVCDVNGKSRHDMITIVHQPDKPELLSEPQFNSEVQQIEGFGGAVIIG